MKILFVSNAPFTRTGYGTATHSVTQQMLRDGHEPHVLAYWGLQGARMEVNGVECYSPRNDQWGNDYMEDLAEYIGADFILIHRDIWVNPESLKRPFAAWFPLDHTPISKMTEKHLKLTQWPATLSRFAQKECEQAGFKVDYIPHSFNPNVFRYNRSREARAVMGVPDDAFCAIMVAANKGFPARKGFPEVFEAYAEFQRRHKDAWLYLHTCATEEAGGPNLNKLAEVTGVDVKRTVLLSPFLHYYGIEDAQLATFYAAADVLLSPSYGEGFGIPILEAQACGTPVITTDITSMPEITWNGWTVPYTPTMTPFYSYWGIPKVSAIVDRLEECYNEDRKLRASRGEDISAYLHREWTDEAVYNTYWRPFLKRIEAELADFPR